MVHLVHVPFHTVAHRDVCLDITEPNIYLEILVLFGYIWVSQIYPGFFEDTEKWVPENPRNIND